MILEKESIYIFVQFLYLFRSKCKAYCSTKKKETINITNQGNAVEKSLYMVIIRK